MEIVTISIVLVVVSSMLAFLCWMLFTSSSSDGLPPGPTIYEAMSTMPDTNNKEDAEFTYNRLVKLGEKHGGLFTLRAFGKKCLIINDWKIMRDAFLGQSEVFAGRPWMYIANHKNTNTDIMFADGPLVKEKRRFTMHHLRNLGVGKTSLETMILDETSKLLDTIQRRLNQKMVINGLFFFPVLSILFKIIAGGQNKKKKKEEEEDEEVEIQKLGKTLMMLAQQGEQKTELNLFPWLRFLPRYAKHMRLLVGMHENVVSVLADIVDEHSDWSTTRGDNDEPRDFMDAYLMEMQRRQTKPEMNYAYGKDHLIGITYDLLVAATGTTPFTMEWALLYMALWPQIQRKVHDELDQIIGRSRLPNYSDHCLYAKMPYLDATILEIHRFATILPLSGIHSTMSATKLQGFEIPGRTTVVQHIFAVHRDPKLWGDPQVFRPERFINADGKVQKPEYLIPFSLGARKCIGESLARVEVFLFLASLLQRFSFGYATGEPPPSLKASSLATRKAATTLYLIAKERK